MNAARWISLACAAGVGVFAVALQPTALVLYALGCVILPLACIWYGDEMGAVSTPPTPGIMVKIVGWILLFVAPLAVYAFKWRLDLVR